MAAEEDLQRWRHDRLDRELEDLYRRAKRTIINEIRGALATGNQGRAVAKRQALDEITRVLDRLGVDGDPVARRAVQEAWEQSVERTADKIAQQGVTAGVEFGFGRISEDAVRALQDQMIGRLDLARRTVGRRVEDLFARAGRREVMLGLLGASGSRRQVSAGLVDQLRARGVKAFVDRAGREWDLDTYARMVARTTTREAVVEGALARMTSQGITLARVSTVSKACPICAPWQGRLVALDGQTTVVDGEDATALGDLPNGGPPFHPNCRHNLFPEATKIVNLRRELEQDPAFAGQLAAARAQAQRIRVGA